MIKRLTFALLDLFVSFFPGAECHNCHISCRKRWLEEKRELTGDPNATDFEPNLYFTLCNGLNHTDLSFTAVDPIMVTPYCDVCGVELGLWY